MNEEIITLPSPAPIAETLSQYNILYPICFGVGAVIGIIAHASWMLGVLFLILPAIIKSLAGAKRSNTLRELRFAIPRPLSGHETAGLLTIPLTHLHMTVSVEGNEALIKHKGMRYWVRYVSNNAFCIAFDDTLASRLLTGHRYAAQYHKAIVAMGLIAYTLQSEAKKIAVAE